MEALVWYFMDKNLQNNIHTYFIRYKFKKVRFRTYLEITTFEAVFNLNINKHFSNKAQAGNRIIIFLTHRYKINYLNATGILLMWGMFNGIFIHFQLPHFEIEMRGWDSRPSMICCRTMLRGQMTYVKATWSEVCICTNEMCFCLVWESLRTAKISAVHLHHKGDKDFYGLSWIIFLPYIDR